jgi:hypothetical protein
MKMTVPKFCLFGLVIASSIVCRAQSHIIAPPRLAVKLSIPHVFYFYPSIQVALEHKLFKNVNMQYDLGWVFSFNPNESEDYQNKKGFRGMAEVRYYLPSPPKIPFYVAAEFYYSRIKFDRSQVIGYGCATGECSFFEYVTHKVENDHQGIGLKYGLLLYPGWNRNRSFFFDINAGVAYRTIAYHDIRKPLTPNDEVFDNDSSEFFRPRESDHTEFRPILGVRIGYTFL